MHGVPLIALKTMPCRRSVTTRDALLNFSTFRLNTSSLFLSETNLSSEYISVCITLPVKALHILSMVCISSFEMFFSQSDLKQRSIPSRFFISSEQSIDITISGVKITLVFENVSRMSRYDFSSRATSRRFLFPA